MLRLSYSSISDFQRCPRYYAHRHIDRRDRIGGGSRPLGFGRSFHKAQEALWGWAGEADDPARLQAATTAFSKEATLEGLSWEDHLLGEVLLIGYAARWDDLRLSFHGTPQPEVKVVGPVLNPSGTPEDGLEIAAVFDVVTTDVDGSTVLAEHKTTKSEIAPGAAYWGSLDLNLQASIYWIVATDAGHQVGHILWDAVRAPEWKRYEATPLDKREFYKRPPAGSTAKPGDPKPGVRLTDETADQFAERVMSKVLTDPNAFYGRQALYRSDDELARVRMDLWSVGKQMQHAVEVGAFPRNLQSCRAFNTECAYLPVCRGEADINDDRLYRLRVRRDETKELF